MNLTALRQTGKRVGGLTKQAIVHRVAPSGSERSASGIYASCAASALSLLPHYRCNRRHREWTWRTDSPCDCPGRYRSPRYTASLSLRETGMWQRC